MTGGYRDVRAWLGELKREVALYRHQTSAIRRASRTGLTKNVWLQYPRWRRGLRVEGSPLGDGRPWMTYGATSFLEEILRPSMRVFEYGSGGSTVFFAQRVREVVSVEHDPLWGERVTQELEARGLRNTRLLVREPEPAPPRATADPADPDGYRSSDEQYRDRVFRGYAAAIDGFPEEHFDLITLDGRARPSCFAHALPRLRPGGYILLDNAERDHYGFIHRTLGSRGWVGYDFSGPGPYNRYFWSTCVWRKAAA